MMETHNLMENKEMKGLNTWVEVVNAKSLKPEVINDNPDLANFDGLVLKKIHKSNITFTFEKLEGGLAGFLDKRVRVCENLPEFVKIAREELC